jgi:hypothetical protein
VAALLTLVALAGCTGSPSVEPETISQSSSETAPAARPLPPATTDTLFLLDAPHLEATLPVNGPLFRTPLPSGTSTAEPLAWTFPRPDLTVLKVTAKVWVDVQGSHLHAGTLTGGCFWQFFLAVHSNEGGQAWGAEACATPEATAVEPGLRELQVVFPAIDLVGVAGDQISLWPAAGTDARAPGSTVELLSGTNEYPSALTIEGLAAPLDMATLLYR